VPDQSPPRLPRFGPHAAVALVAILLGLAAGGEALAAQPASSASRVAPGMSDADYWTVADRMMSGLDA